MKELVVFLAKALVDEPDQVDVQVVEEDRAWVFELTVAQEDLGKVIGKEGRTARAMRTLLSSMSARGRKRAVLDILE
ncbi:MAG: KH domain-containing protein [Myxococcota bacterium]